ncbi:MAG: TetR/AcrR family transcriptional regulator [Frankia sp.]
MDLPTRVRRRPADAEREILAAAQVLLTEEHRPTLTVADLMAHTGLARSSFYVYFRDVPDLLRRLLSEFEDELFALSDAFGSGRGDPVVACRHLCEGIVAVHRRHGAVLRIVARVAPDDEGVAVSYRRTAIEHLVRATTERIAARADRTDGGELQRASDPISGTDPGPIPHDAGRALVLMTHAYLADTLDQVPAEDPATVTETLTYVWARTLGVPERGTGGVGSGAP